jgi:hypothetical protein
MYIHVVYSIDLPCLAVHPEIIEIDREIDR